MDAERFSRLLEAFRADLTRHQRAVLQECARLAPSWDAFVDLVVLTELLADPRARRSDVRARVSAMARQPYGPLLPLLC